MNGELLDALKSGNVSLEDTALHCLEQGWSNLFNQGPNLRMSGHRRAGHGATVYAKIGR